MNDRTIAETLSREYHQLSDDTNPQWIYEMKLGADRLAPFLGVTTIRDNLRAMTTLSGVHSPAPVQPS